MKTVISLPEELVGSVTAWVSALGVTRSQFFAQAAERYVAELEAESLTRQIDEALERIGSYDSGWDEG